MGALGLARSVWYSPNQTRTKRTMPPYTATTPGSMSAVVGQGASPKNHVPPISLELEGRAGQRGADADGHDGDEAEQRGPAQERPVVVRDLGLDALGQRDARREAEAQRVGAHREPAETRLDPVEHRRWGGHRAFVHWGVSLACMAGGLGPGREDRPRPQSLVPQSI